MEREFVKRSCDSPLCSTVITIDKLSPNFEDLKTWIVLVTFKVGKGPNGQDQLVQDVKNACKATCVTNILNIALVCIPDFSSHPSNTSSEVSR